MSIETNIGLPGYPRKFIPTLFQNLYSKDDEVWHELIDFSNNREVIKKCAMTVNEAHERNKVLTGLRMEWRRVIL